MRVSRVHVDAPLQVGDELDLAAGPGHYLLHVLRLKSGAAVTLFNGREAIEYQARLTGDRRQARVRIESSEAVSVESNLDVRVMQSLIRPDNLDWVIQKCTELGVRGMVLFNAERTQTHLKPAQLEKKLAHWRGIAISACEQCGRTLLPEIAFVDSLDQAIEGCDSGVLLDFEAPPLAQQLTNEDNSLNLLIGPEGGLNPAEIETARARGFVPASLGPRVLRSETAAVAALAIAQSVLGDLG